MATNFETAQSERPPRVSVVIPAYKAKYLQATLDSLLAQDFSDYEVIVGDDCPTDDVFHMFSTWVEKNQLVNFRYFRNKPALGGGGNLARCVGYARGEFIKPVFDDDLLLPGALTRLAAVLSEDDRVSVVSSRRILIDENGLTLPDYVPSLSFFDEDVQIHGKDLTSFLGDTTLNFIGEPSVFMFRKRDFQPIIAEHQGLFKLGGQYIIWIGDLAILAKLMRRGNLVLLHEPYSAFRISKEQFSQEGREKPGVGEKGHQDFRRMIRQLGWYRAENNHLVRVKPQNDARKGFQALDLRQRISERARSLSASARHIGWDVSDWMIERAPSGARILAIQTMLQANPDVGTLGVVIVVPDDAPLEALVTSLESVGVQHREVDAVWLVGGNLPAEAAGAGIELLHDARPWPQVVSDRLARGGAPDFLWILHAGDRLVPHATLLMGEYRLRKPDPLVWYVDEASLKDGAPVNPMLKPDMNIDMLRNVPYIGRSVIVSTAAVQAAGGLDGRVADLALIDFIWRLVELVGPGVVGHIPEVLLLGARSLSEWVEAPETQVWFPAVTQAHFVRLGIDAQIAPGLRPGLQRITYPLPIRPLVTIIIPTRDQLSVLRTCIEGLMERTAYVNYELLIVDNQSIEPDAVAFLAGLEGLDNSRVRVLRWAHAFNFSEMNNFAVHEARGDVLLFLNNDIQFPPRTRADWLERMLRHALRAEVGMVGSRLDLPDGTVDQAGLVLGMDNSVGSAFHRLPADRQGYMNRLIVQQNVSALSASCLMMRREIFEELGGFDAESFPVYYADADLCLRATKAGYLLVLEPDTGLLHMGGATRLLTQKFGLAGQPDDEQRDRLYGRWLPQLARDPNYHTAFGKHSPGFDLRPDASRIHEPLPGRPLPVVLASHADWQGCGHYRILHPFQALAAELSLEGGLKLNPFHFTDVARIEPDVIILQGAWAHEGILTEIRRYREITGAKVVLEFDDYLPNIPTRSIYRQQFSRSVLKNMRRAIEQVDWLVVSTPTLAEEYASYHHDIRVAQNGLLPDWWGNLRAERGRGRKMRVGWAGGASHTGDLAEIRSVVKDLGEEVEWVFMGMKPEGVDCEYHEGVAIDKYPSKLAALNLDLAVVPLEVNQFNRCKSNLRLLELGACGVPVICTDIEPYRDLPVTRVRNRHQAWVDAIRSHLAEPEALASAGDKLRETVLRDWMLEGVFLNQWRAAWLGSASIQPHRHQN